MFELLGSSDVRKLGIDPAGAQAAQETRIDLGEVSLALFPRTYSRSLSQQCEPWPLRDWQDHIYQVSDGFDYSYICEESARGLEEILPFEWLDLRLVTTRRHGDLRAIEPHSAAASDEFLKPVQHEFV